MSAERRSTRVVLLAGGTPAVNLPVLRPVVYRAVQELTTTGRLYIYILIYTEAGANFVNPRLTVRHSLLPMQAQGILGEAV